MSESDPKNKRFPDNYFVSETGRIVELHNGSNEPLEGTHAPGTEDAAEEFPVDRFESESHSSRTKPTNS